MKVFPKEQLDAKIVCMSLPFVALNVADAWLIRQLVGKGFHEASTIVTAYDSNLVVKGLLALVIVWLLVRCNKAWLLLILTCFMLVVVLWNGIELLWVSSMQRSGKFF